MNWLKGIVCFLLILPFAVSKAHAQIPADTIVKNCIDQKKFVFTVIFINSDIGNPKLSNGNYSLRVNQDSVVSYLPYYGRVYSGIDNSTPSPQPITFTRCDWKVQQKKGTWIISIKPQTKSNVREWNMFVTSKGYATLTVMYKDKDPISYDGRISDMASKL